LLRHLSQTFLFEAITVLAVAVICIALNGL
jgi:hypothetical protein